MQQALSVSELTFAIKSKLETTFPSVCVKGEISNFKAQSSGHLYFTLKDEGAQISAALFKGNTRFLSRMPQSGDAVIAQGELSVYPPRGNYQLIVRSLQFQGVGDLLLKFHELKAKLEGKGWFAKEHKKPLPRHPKTIGVVTSPTGSVIQDILHVLKRRFSGFHLVLNPVKVQGEGAAEEIARAIEQMNQYNLADVLIVGRGGGSLEDLWPFNEERVAEAIFRSRIPVISAVGHETDVTLADFVADVRAPTPSAAAEIATGEKAEQLKHLALCKKRLVHALSTRFQHISQRLGDLNDALERAALHSVRHKQLQLQGYLRQKEALSPIQQLKGWRTRFQGARTQLTHLAQESIRLRKERLASLLRHLKAIDPKNLLSKGYALLFDEKGESVIFSSKQLVPASRISLLLSDGRAQATIDEVTSTLQLF